MWAVLFIIDFLVTRCLNHVVDIGMNALCNGESVMCDFCSCYIKMGTVVLFREATVKSSQ